MQIASQSHEKYDSFVCCILSYGFLDCIYGTDNREVRISEISTLFKGHSCPTLTGKPKLFFFNADRGHNRDRGVYVQKDDEDKVVVWKDNTDKVVVQKPDGEDKVVVQKDDEMNAKDDPDDDFIPSEADFLFGYATSSDYVSWISSRHGSFYISKLCEVFLDYATQQDLLSMLTIVNHKVSVSVMYAFEEKCKQCPAPVTLLRKQVWFFGNLLINAAS